MSEKRRYNVLSFTVASGQWYAWVNALLRASKGARNKHCTWNWSQETGTKGVMDGQSGSDPGKTLLSVGLYNVCVVGMCGMVSLDLLARERLCGWMRALFKCACVCVYVWPKCVCWVKGKQIETEQLSCSPWLPKQWVYPASNLLTNSQLENTRTYTHLWGMNIDFPPTSSPRFIIHSSIKTALTKMEEKAGWRCVRESRGREGKGEIKRRRKTHKPAAKLHANYFTHTQIPSHQRRANRICRLLHSASTSSSATKSEALMMR